jgi:phospholipid/cholesterol/gamma-HCH transport system ATP-binding protein
MGNKEIILTVEDVHKSFGNRVVLAGVNLELKDNESIVILGRSGVGKTVLLRLIMGLDKPDKGKITIFNQDIWKLEDMRLMWIKSSIAMIFQENALFDYLTVRENIRFYLDEHTKIEESKKDFLVKESLKQVQLAEEILDLYPYALSFGMKKRVALARALIYSPRIILFDEPTIGLDPITAKEIAKLIKEVQQRLKLSILVVTHDMQLAKYLSEKIYLLNKGRLTKDYEFLFKP